MVVPQAIALGVPLRVYFSDTGDRQSWKTAKAVNPPTACTTPEASEITIGRDRD